jgi:hypothetical protein
MEKLIDLGESKFGVSFFTPVEFERPKGKRQDQHIRMKKCHVNCYPEYMTQALHLISTSIQNVVSFLKAVNGMEPMHGNRPAGDDWFEALCRMRTGLTDLVGDQRIDEKDIIPFDEAELRRLFEKEQLTVEIER